MDGTGSWRWAQGSFFVTLETESLEAAGVPVGAGGDYRSKLNRSGALTHDTNKPTNEHTNEQYGQRRNDRLTVRDAVAASKRYRWTL